MKEASENKMEISDFDEETVKNMVNFIYHGEIETECFTQELLGISEKYDINELKKRYSIVISVMVCCLKSHFYD